MIIQKELSMRHPLWLVDSTFLILFLAAAIFVFFSQQKLPKRITLQSETIKTASVKTAPSIDITQIYENDLFNTYQKTVQPISQPDYSHPMPQVPTQSTVSAPEQKNQPLLEPLNIKLKGVIVLNDASNNIAIIADTKSSEQKNYKVGDLIEDAQLIRILSNRIILIRSNGQQEVLYLNEKDIEKSPLVQSEKAHWATVVKKIHDELFLLDPEMFCLVVRNIAQLIDLLDLTTLYQSGKSIGCRVGNIMPDSLGAAMGIEPFDVVTLIDTLPVNETEQRHTVYQKLLEKKEGQTVVIELLRNNAPLTFTYQLHDLKDPFDDTLHAMQKTEKLEGITDQSYTQDIQEERLNLLREKYKFAPTAQEIKIQQKTTMLKEGKQQ